MTKPRIAAVIALLALAACAGPIATDPKTPGLHPVADDCIGCWNNR